jgi:hypothetical protein
MFDILAILSLLMLALATYFWLRSFLPADLHVGLRDGKLILVFDDSPWSERATILDALRSARVNRAEHWGFMGIEVLSGGNSRFTEGTIRIIAVPIPYLMLLLAVAPTWWWISARRGRKRGNAGLCLHCGYDLRESAGRCPECGTAVPARPAPEIAPS